MRTSSAPWSRSPRMHRRWTGSSASAAATSGLLCMAIIGGAILPQITGRIADAAGLHAAYLLPMAAYAAISVFAMMAAKARVAGVGQVAGNAAGHVAH